jgi:hypothetical protein
MDFRSVVSKTNGLREFFEFIMNSMNFVMFINIGHIVDKCSNTLNG